MSKFFKRLGTKSIKFTVHFTLNKVLLHITQQVKVAVAIQRGEHSFQTPPADAGSGNEIDFENEFKIPVTLYYDKKKQTYQEKEIILTLKIITPKKVIDAGITKFDLASYLNQKKDMHDQLLVEKCIDKKAKFDFTLKFVQLDGDKGKKDQNGVSHRDDKSEDDSKFDHSRDHSNDSDDHDNTTSDNEDKRAKSAEPKGPKALKDFFNPKLDKITKGNENPRSPLGTPNSDITVINNSSVRSLELKITELETKNTFYKKENDTLALEIQKIKSEREKLRLDYQNLKSEHEKLKSDYEILLNDHTVENTIEERTGLASKGYKERAFELQQEIDELKNEKKSLRDKIEELTKVNEELSYKFTILQKKDKDKSTVESLEIEKLQETINDLTARIKKADTNLKLTKEALQKENESLQIEKTELETKNRTLHRDILQKESSISDLQSINAQLKAENEIYKKKNNGGSADISKYIKQIEEAQLAHKAIEEKYKNRIDELSKEINDIKSEQTKKTESNFTSTKADMGELALENEKLSKRIKELESKQKSKHDCQCEDLKRQLAELKGEKESLMNDLAKNNSKKNFDDEKEKINQKFREQDENMKELQGKIEDLMMQIFKLKSKIGALMNAALESGVPELLESFESILSG